MALRAEVPRAIGSVHRSVVIVGGGQASPSMSYYLTQRNVDPPCPGMGSDRSRVARSALGLVLPRHSELAMPVTGLSLPGG
jgi:hypothetical protein